MRRRRSWRWWRGRVRKVRWVRFRERKWIGMSGLSGIFGFVQQFGFLSGMLSIFVGGRAGNLARSCTIVSMRRLRVAGS